MDQNPRMSSVKRRLILQDEILKRMEEFSEKMQRRAGEVTKELHGLEDHAGAVERDLRNTLNCFRQLSNCRIVENRISDEDDLHLNTGEGTQSSTGGGVPAQSYEADILPRYKEALTLGLASCRNHLEKTNKSYPGSSQSKIGSARGPLPHVIGSEEYIHDNTCGLIDDLVLETSGNDFNRMGGPSEFEEGEPNHLFNVDLFGMQQGSTEKDGSEPLVSAVSDFKAMLEAALLSPYKFYDEETSSHPGGGSSNISELEAKNLDQVTSETMHPAVSPPTQHIQDMVNSGTSPGQGSDIHSHEVSALLSGGLFDTEDESDPSSQIPSVSTHVSVAEDMVGSPDFVDDNNLSGSPPASPIQERVGSVDDDVLTIQHSGANASVK